MVTIHPTLGLAQKLLHVRHARWLDNSLKNKQELVILEGKLLGLASRLAHQMVKVHLDMSWTEWWLMHLILGLFLSPVS